MENKKQKPEKQIEIFCWKYYVEFVVECWRRKWKRIAQKVAEKDVENICVEWK